MSTNHLTKHQIIHQINLASTKYKKILLNKSFMFVFNNRYIEVVFRANNFKHLTGVKSKLYAKDFFRKSVEFKLYPNDFGFDFEHRKELSIKKLKCLNEIDKITNSNCLILKEIKTKTSIYKYGITNLIFTLMFESDLNKKGELNSNMLIVKSLREGDCISKSKSKYIVDYIFFKNISDLKYKCISYSRIKERLISSKKIIYKIDKTLLNKLGYNTTDLK